MQGLNPNGKLQMVRVDADGKLVVTGVAGGGGGSGTSDTTEATQLLVKAAVQNLDADIGTPADAAASSDSGTFGLIALVKRGLGNWTSLLGRIPQLVGGRVQVDTDRVTKQLVDAASSTVTYVCEASSISAATSAASWRIKRITVSGNVTTIQWGGTGAFDQIADNRATTVVYA